MKTQTFLWTALPNGHTGQVLRLSAFLSPRLVTDEDPPAPRLAGFPDFVSWPDLIGHAGFDVELSGGTGPAMQFPARRVGPPVDAARWNALFPPDTFVRSHGFEDLSGRKLRSFPVGYIRQFILGLYKTIAESSATSHPSRSDAPLSDLIRELGLLYAHRREAGKTAERVLEEERVLKRGLPHGFPSMTSLAFWQAGRFYERPGIDPDVLPGRPRPPDIDFHQMVTALTSYPELLRLFGLVVDLEVVLEPERMPPRSGEVRVLPRWGRHHAPAWLGNTAPAPTHTDVSLKTRYLLDASGFLSRPRPHSDIQDGLLRLERPELFESYQADVDGAALKLYDFASNMRRLLEQPEGQGALNPEETGLPALRSSGFTVARVHRAELTHERLLRAKDSNTALTAGQPQGVEALHADELVRGYRVDVHDAERGQWFSLHARTGGYAFPRTGLEPVTSTDPEGYLKGASASTAPDGSPDLYLHESLFGWDGWSLSVPRPGRAIVPVPEGARQDEAVQRTGNEAETALALVPHFQARELPRLRYGRKYRMRARVVDLAGNSLPANHPDMVHATPSLTFYRYEPVPPPVLVLRDRISEGESLERLVIRSDVGVPAGEYGKQPHVLEALEGLPYAYHGLNERHVVPPKTSQLMAELHGRFDEALGSGKDYTKWFNLASREEGTLSDSFIVDLQTGQPTIPVPGLQLITPPGVQAPPGESLPTLPLTRGEPLAPGQYLIHTEAQLRLPYLPDVFARGAAFLGLPGVTAGKTFHVPFKTEHWPEVPPFRLRIEEGTGEPDPAGGVLTVRLPKGTISTVRFSSFLGPEDLEQMGIWALLDRSARDRLLEDARNGRHWMLTPYRELALVHAVQRPLEVPSFDQVVSLKKLGETSATFSGQLRSHAPSTGRLAVEARWSETVDLLSKDSPEVIQGAARVADFDLRYEEDPASLTPGRMVHELGDTKYRVVEYFSVATTRYREYFHPEITRIVSRITRSGEASPPGALNQGTGERIRLEILNSARPAVPEVLYVVPTFGWEKVELPGGGLRSTRRGGGLRVYLDRPWFSSGDGELLAVLLWDSSKGRIPERVAPYVTQWGVDPLWDPTADRPLSPAVKDFGRAARVLPGLDLEELQAAGAVVTAVGHRVEYDAGRKLWFSDIVIEPGQTYTPFIRLALARLQPRSVPGAHLSRVVHADFMQLAPDRTATLQFFAQTPRKLRVTVRGVYGLNDLTQNMSVPNGNTEPIPHLEASRVVRVRVEEPLAGLSDELRWSQVGDEVTLQAIPPSDNVMVWRGDVELAKVPRRMGGAQSYRILIQEFDVLRTDFDPQIIHRLVFDEDKHKRYAVRERIVYADAFEI